MAPNGPRARRTGSGIVRVMARLSVHTLVAGLLIAGGGSSTLASAAANGAFARPTSARHTPQSPARPHAMPTRHI